MMNLIFWLILNHWHFVNLFQHWFVYVITSVKATLVVVVVRTRLGFIITTICRLFITGYWVPNKKFFCLSVLSSNKIFQVQCTIISFPNSAEWWFWFWKISDITWACMCSNRCFDICCWNQYWNLVSTFPINTVFITTYFPHSYHHEQYHW